MKLIASLSLLLCFLFLTDTSRADVSQVQEQSPRLMVHLLDYIGIDYPGAVSNGKVINQLEYGEMMEFTSSLMELNQKFPETRGAAGIAADLKALNELVKQKASPEQVNKLAQDIKWKVIGVSGIVLAPSYWPNLHRGKKLYGENCAQCHGANGYGDGPAGTNLDPKPSNFHDAEKFSKITAFQSYNAIRLGVPGTGMQPQSQFSDSEVWDLAFYVISLRHQAKDEKFIATLPPNISLQQATTLSEEQLSELLPGSSDDKKKAITAIRTHSSQGEDSRAFIELARTNLKEVASDYAAANVESAKHKALIAYLNGIEPVEPRIRANDPGLLVEIEERMNGVRSAVDRRVGQAEVDEKVKLALETLVKVEASLSKTTSPSMTFTVSAGIVLREAFEAIFLLIALLGVIRSVGSAKAAFFVHLGWISACGVGVLLWFFSGWVMTMSGAGRETLEGVVSLIAVFVVLYMGFWLHRKTEIGRWRTFLNDMAKTIVSGKSLFLLAGISFMAVFREAFETVLFLRAVLLESGGGHQAAMVGGVLTAFFAVVILTIALVRFSAKLPIRRLFDASALVMVVLAFVLMGKAVHSFQEAGFFSVTEFPVRLRLDLFGIYPTYETLIPQLVIFAISLGFWFSNKKSVVNSAQPSA